MGSPSWPSGEISSPAVNAKAAAAIWLEEDRKKREAPWRRSKMTWEEAARFIIAVHFWLSKAAVPCHDGVIPAAVRKGYR